MTAPALDPVLATARRGDLAVVVAVCPRHGCDWREENASAEVANQYGVWDVIPSHCGVHRQTRVKVARIVKIVR